jgi:hypothetical protein
VWTKHCLPNAEAQLIVDIAMGAVKDREDNGKDPNAAALGRKGGAARAEKLTAEQRSEIARKGAAKRWGRSN